MKRTLRNALLGTFALGLAVAAASAVPQGAQAESVTVEPGHNDRAAIQSVLDDGNDAVLVSGGEYHLNGNLYVKSGTSITATGATVYCKNGAFRSKVEKGKYRYNSLKTFTATGGTWKNESPKGYTASMVQFTHASNITIENAYVEANYEGHAVEFIACKNVNVVNCTLKGVGTPKKNSVEEQLQIDIAAPNTAPTIKSAYGSKAVKGQTCRNVTVKNCTITGCRALTTNYSRLAKYRNKFHKNITITGCKLTGVKSEALALFNVLGKVTVKNNTIVSKSGRTGTAYSVGLHAALCGKASAKTARKSRLNFSGNTVRGGRQGIFVFSHSSSRYGKVTIKKNKAYSKRGKASAIQIGDGAASKKKVSKNKTYKW